MPNGTTAGHHQIAGGICGGQDDRGGGADSDVGAVIADRATEAVARVGQRDVACGGEGGVAAGNQGAGLGHGAATHQIQGASGSAASKNQRRAIGDRHIGATEGHCATEAVGGGAQQDIARSADHGVASDGQGAGLGDSPRAGQGQRAGGGAGRQSQRCAIIQRHIDTAESHGAAKVVASASQGDVAGGGEGRVAPCRQGAGLGEDSAAGQGQGAGGAGSGQAEACASGDSDIGAGEGDGTREHIGRVGKADVCAGEGGVAGDGQGASLGDGTR